MSKHTWNHRLIRHIEEIPGTNGEKWEYLQIHEVHYTDDIPTLVTNDGVSVGGDTLEEVKETLELMKKCLDQPIIDMTYFDNLPKEDEDFDDISEIT